MQRVEIRVTGHLDESWQEWLEGFTFTYTEQNETVLTGTVRDQAALYGLIAKLRDMGIQLVTVNIQPEQDNPIG
jgi:hypothetical protein